MKLMKLLLIFSTLLFSSTETNPNMCHEAYSINELDGAGDSSSYSDNYFSKWSNNKSIYLQFTTLENGNLDFKLLKSASSSMKYQLFIGRSCNDLSVVSNTSYQYEHNSTIKIYKNKKYIVKLVKEKNGYSRYRLDFDFKSIKQLVETNGLIAKYYSNDNFRGVPKTSKVDTNIDFNGTLSLLNNQEYSVKWSGYIYIPNDGDYHFRVNQDDNIKVIVNSENIYERHISSDGKFQLSHKRNFKKGYYLIEIFYNTNKGSNTLQLAWVNYAISKELEIIGSENFFTYEPNDDELLPPKPDKNLNNATLGGVDSNNNGVRDDVEIKIYQNYPKKLHRALLMDGAKQLQQTMTKSLDYAKDIEKDLSRTTDCSVYLGGINQKIESNFLMSSYLENITFNNPQRVRKYLDYNIALSGGNYASYPSDWERHSCSDDVIIALEEMGL